MYEEFFESGLRDRVPSLVVKVLEALEISPGQLNPPSWKIFNLCLARSWWVIVVSSVVCNDKTLTIPVSFCRRALRGFFSSKEDD